jgi:hypothetical protein
VSRTPKLVGIGLAVAVVAGCGGGSDEPSAPATLPQPTQAQLAAANLDKLKLAPESERVDIAAPTFSNPTEVTNPLFPISDLHSVIFSGRVEGKPFHTETTLLPETRIVEWAPGQQVETLISQYIAYLNGRITEAAIDRYAQADDGSVWYFGEDVYDYRQGEIFSTEGTWLAGRDGPPSMIMPGDPQVGQVARAENIPGIAFEEVAVKTVDKTVDGPTGPVEGAMVAEETHDDGATSDKIFAPGYGEFFTRDRGEVEAMALAVPADAADPPVPPALDAMSAGADDAFDALQSKDWNAAATGERAAVRAWRDYQRGEVPRRLGLEMDTALDALATAIEGRDQTRAGTATIDVAQSTTDLMLRDRPPVEIDLARFELWARQILVDASAGDLGGVTGDVATMEWIRDRIAASLDSVDRTRIDTQLLTLSESVADKDLGAASHAAERLLGGVSRLEPGSAS